MNGMSLVRRAALLAIGATFVAGASAQTLDFGSCVRIEDLSARLACYDRAAGRTPSAQRAPATAAAPAAPSAPSAPTVAPAAPAPLPVPPARAKAAEPRPAAAMPQDPVATFGAEKAGDDLTAAKAQTKAKAADPTVKQIEARITAVRTRPEGQQVITLENGQVWTQNEVQREPQLQVGDVVVIRRGMLGSFLLNLQKGSATTRVRRIS